MTRSDQSPDDAIVSKTAAHLEAVVGMVGICRPQEVELHIVGLILQDLPLKAEACKSAQQQSLRRGF